MNNEYYNGILYNFNTLGLNPFNNVILYLNIVLKYDFLLTQLKFIFIFNLYTWIKIEHCLCLLKLNIYWLLMIFVISFESDNVIEQI